MSFNKNKSKNLLIVLLKTFIFVIGVDIFLTSFLNIIYLEFKKSNLKSEMHLINKKLKSDRYVLSDVDIY